MAGKRFMIMAGGTGGHVFPALATARHLQAMGHEVSWLGSRGGMEVDLIGGTDIPLSLIAVSGLRGKGGLARVLAPLRLARAILQAWQVLRRVQPDCVVGMGGFVSGPGGLVAWLMRRPLVIHEQNAIAGMTNRWLSRFAQITLEAFPGAFGPETVTRCTGNPVRQDLLDLPDPSQRIGVEQRMRILVLGGSRGRRLSMNVLRWRSPRCRGATVRRSSISVVVIILRPPGRPIGPQTLRRRWCRLSRIWRRPTGTRIS